MIAATLTTLLSSVPITTMPTYIVVDVERRSVFAGKLGHRVYETLVVESHGKTYSIKLNDAYHTRMRSTPRFSPGDRVTLPSAAIEKGRVTLHCK